MALRQQDLEQPQHQQKRYHRKHPVIKIRSNQMQFAPETLERTIKTINNHV